MNKIIGFERLHNTTLYTDKRFTASVTEFREKDQRNQLVNSYIATVIDSLNGHRDMEFFGNESDAQDYCIAKIKEYCSYPLVGTLS